MPVVGLGGVARQPSQDGFERGTLAGFREGLLRVTLADLVGIDGPKRFRELAR